MSATCWQACHLYRAGMSLREVGERLGVSHHTVWYHLRRAQVRRRPVGRPRAEAA